MIEVSPAGLCDFSRIGLRRCRRRPNRRSLDGVGAENRATSCDLHVLVDKGAEPAVKGPEPAATDVPELRSLVFSQVSDLCRRPWG
jgi:hypothetical protein